MRVPAYHVRHGEREVGPRDKPRGERLDVAGAVEAVVGEVVAKGRGEAATVLPDARAQVVQRAAAPVQGTTQWCAVHCCGPAQPLYLQLGPHDSTGDSTG